MPTPTVTEISDSVSFVKGVVVPAVYNGRLYIVNVYAGRAAVIDVDGKQVIDLGELDANTLAVNSRFLGVHYNPPIVKIRHAYARSGELVIAVDKVDLSAMQVTRTELRTVSLSWLTRWEDIAHSAAIPPLLVLLPDWDNGDVHYVNVETGSVVDIDLGAAEHINEYRFSHKWIVKENDIEMHTGVHLSGTNHEKWSVYSHTRTDLGFSTGRAARPCMGGMAIFTDEILMLGSGGGVVDADNDFAVMDHNFSLLAMIDLSAILGFNAAVPCGHIIAKKSDGGYYAILGSDNNASDYATKFAAYWVELDSSFNVQSSTKLIEVSTDTSTSSNLYPGYSDITAAPVLHLQRKKIYFHVRDGKLNKGWLVEVDISDVWGNIEEFNQRMWIVGAGKIPTIMTLAVVPL